MPDATTGTAKNWRSYSLLLCAVLAAEALFIAAEKQIAARWGFSLDDSWIHATIARNLASGYGYSFNRGELVGGSQRPRSTHCYWLLCTAPLETSFGAQRL